MCECVVWMKAQLEHGRNGQRLGNVGAHTTRQAIPPFPPSAPSLLQSKPARRRLSIISPRDNSKALKLTSLPHFPVSPDPFLLPLFPICSWTSSRGKGAFLAFIFSPSFILADSLLEYLSMASSITHVGGDLIHDVDERRCDKAAHTRHLSRRKHD